MRACCLYFVVASAALAGGCGEGTCCSAPDDAVLRIALAMSGLDLDDDGALASVDQAPSVVVPREQAVALSLTPGHHTITLSGLAPNCTAAGGVRREVEVNSGGVTEVTFEVICIERDGVLRLIAATSGILPDLDGYDVTLELPVPRHFHLAANDTVLVTDVPPGLYGLTLDGLAGNCSFASPPPATISVAARDTALVRFAFACVDAVLRVSAPTTGEDVDANYLVWVDERTDHPLAAGSVLALDLWPGAHTIRLDDIRPNCTVDGTNPVSVTLSTAAPTDVVFPVTCVAVPPAPRTGLDVVIETTGIDPDESYTLTACDIVDVECSVSYHVSIVPANFTLHLDLPAATYDLRLGDVAPNCHVQWTGIPAEVTWGAVTVVRADVTCDAPPSPAAPAEVVVSVTTSGTDRQEVFGLRIDGRDSWLPAGREVTVPSYEGMHRIELRELRENCHVTSPNPVTVTLVAGVLTPVEFMAQCEPLPRISVAVSTMGSGIPYGYLVDVDYDWAIDQFDYSAVVVANGMVAFLGTTAELTFRVSCQ
jgi:hypothetical protein